MTDDYGVVSASGEITPTSETAATMRPLYEAPALPNKGDGAAPPASRLNTYELRRALQDLPSIGGMPSRQPELIEDNDLPY